MEQMPYQESNSDAYSSYSASCWTLDILGPPPPSTHPKNTIFTQYKQI